MSLSSQAQAQMPLKDRIAALQQKPNQASSHPSAAPARSSTLSSTGQSTTPPKGTLRDKINKFERKGGVPVPRGSFGMGAPPVTDAGSTKSRELYGNRITSVDRKPGADPLQNGSRSTTAPSAFNHSVTPGIDGLPTERLPLSPDITGESTPDLSALKPRRRLSVVEAIEQYNDLDGVPVSVRSSRRSSQILSPPSAVAALPGVDPDVAVDGGESQPLSSLPTPPPSATTESPQPQMLAKLTPPQKPPMNRAESSTSITSTSPDVPQTPYSVMSANHAEILSGVRTAITPANSKPTPVVLTHTKSSSSTTSAGGKTPTATSPPPPIKAVPAPIDVPTSPVSEPSLTPVPVTTKSYKVVVHRQPTEQNNTDQNSQDGHTLSHIRSKRHFKHLSANPDPPSPGGGAELSDLLKDAAWFEETLGASFDIPSVTLDSVPAVSVAPAEALRTPTARPSPAGPISSSASAPSLSMPSSLTASPLLSTPPSSRSQTSLSAASTSTAQEIPPTPPPKSARTRRFFSLRSRSASERMSMSSEMSSDDSVPVATPPSPPNEGPLETLSMRSAKSGVSASTSGSFRLSPHRGIARAATFAERMLGRASKTRSMVDELPTAIPEQTFKLPSPVPERSFDISLSSDSGSPAGVSFDFDAFPSVPQDAPSRTDSSRR